MHSNANKRQSHSAIPHLSCGDVYFSVVKFDRDEHTLKELASKFVESYVTADDNEVTDVKSGGSIKQALCFSKNKGLRLEDTSVVRHK